MKKIKNVLSQYGLDIYDIIQKESLLLQLSRESISKLAHYLKELETHNNPDIYEIRKNVERICYQINENEYRMSSASLQSIIENYFFKLGLMNDSEELTKDKAVFLEQLLKISKNHFNFENTIETISRRDYIRLLIDNARESFLITRLAEF